MSLLSFFEKAIRFNLVRRGAESRRAAVLGQSVHYYRAAGRPGVRQERAFGAPVVLVHGLGGSANGFSQILLPLSRRFPAVFVPDLPGSGFSPPPERGPLDLEGLLAVLRAFIAQEVGEPVFLIGNSLGGAMAIELAHREPRWVRALALIAPAGAKVEGKSTREILDAFDMSSTANARALIRRLFHRPPLLSLALAGQLRSLFDSPHVRAVRAMVKPTDGIEVASLRSLTMPTLLLWGQSDRLLPQEGLTYFRQHLPGSAQIHAVEEFGHVPHVERPAELLRRLEEFARGAGL